MKTLTQGNALLALEDQRGRIRAERFLDFVRIGRSWLGPNDPQPGHDAWRAWEEALIQAKIAYLGCERDQLGVTVDVHVEDGRLVRYRMTYQGFRRLRWDTERQEKMAREALGATDA